MTKPAATAIAEEIADRLFIDSRKFVLVLMPRLNCQLVGWHHDTVIREIVAVLTEKGGK